MQPVGSNSRKPAMAFIFITILIDVIGFGLIIPVIPSIISNLKHIPVNEASKYGGVLLTVFALMQFVFSPIIGGLSDQYGRRPVLLFALFGFAVDYFLTAWAPTYEWLFVGRVFAGIAGSSISTATSYIADISTNENRAQNFGMVGAAFGVGFIIGPIIGATVSHFYGPNATFIVAGVFTLLNFFYGYFVLPESLAKENRRAFSWKRANPVGTLIHFKKYPKVLTLAMAMLLVFIASHSVQSTWPYFTKYRFQWNELSVGISLGVVGLIVGLVQGGLTRYTIPKLGNEKSIYIGLFFYAIGAFLFSMANQSWMMYAFLLPYCLGGISQPALQSVLSGQVPPNQQGELQGGLTSLQSLAAIIGPFMMTNVFSYFSSDKAFVYFPGAAFLLGAIIILLSIGVARIALVKK